MTHLAPSLAILAAVAILCCTGCTSHTAAADLSTWDLLFRADELETYLDTRRQVLSQLQARVDTLDGEFLGKLGTLQGMKRELAELQVSSTASQLEVARLGRDVAQRQEDLGESWKEIAKAGNDLAQARHNASLARQDLKQDREKIAELRTEVDELEQTNRELDEWIEETLSLRLEQIRVRKSANGPKPEGPDQ